MTIKAETAVVGGGCFWCLEAVYQRIEGVTAVESGYAGGQTLNPTYQDICTGQSGHAEVVRISHDPEKISFAGILEWFWRCHDPTTLNRQGADVGTQYRSIILYQDESQKTAAEQSKADAAGQFKDAIVTEIVPLETFYPAEDYHQNYFNENGAAPYCTYVIRPKLHKLDMA